MYQFFNDFLYDKMTFGATMLVLVCAVTLATPFVAIRSIMAIKKEGK